MYLFLMLSFGLMTFVIAEVWPEINGRDNAKQQPNCSEKGMTLIS